MRWLMLAAACCLSGCASDQLTGFVTPLSSEAAARVAYDITAFVGDEMPPAAGPIAVFQPPGDVLVWPVLTDDLRAAGYMLVAAGGRHQLRYAVSMSPDGTVLRATLGPYSMARMYHQAGADLEPSGPATIMAEGE